MRVMVLLSVLLCSLPSFGQLTRDQEVARQNRAIVRASAPQVVAAYDALAPLNNVQRNAMLRAMQPETRIALWQAHIGFVVAEHSELTPRQRAAIDAMANTLVPVLFDYSPASDLDRMAARVDVDKALDQAKLVLPNDLVRQLFFRIGPPAPLFTAPAFHAKSDVVDCSCSGFPDDPCALACYGRICVKYQDGCGPYGDDACVDVCLG